MHTEMKREKGRNRKNEDKREGNNKRKLTGSY
jgi:hypothetical protein